jgi:hypothetical protein
LAIQDLKEPHGAKSHASLWVADGRWPPAGTHQLLVLLNSTVAQAKVYLDVVHAGQVDDNKVLVRPEWIWAAVTGGMTELNDEAEVLQGTSLEKIASPLLHRVSAASCSKSRLVSL